jgi:hypothetical protein
MEKLSIAELCEKIINDRGGKCIGCDCKPNFIVTNPSKEVVKPSPTMTHDLNSENMSLRLTCKANSVLHRSYKGGRSHEDCRSRKHLVDRGG